jgi:hypothetical protein
MKVLLTQGTSYYLVDLEKQKEQSLREVLLASADSELVIVNLADQDTTDLDQLLGEALAARATPVAEPVSPAEPTDKKKPPAEPGIDTKARAWWLELSPEDQQKITSEAINKVGRVQKVIRDAYQASQ